MPGPELQHILLLAIVAISLLLMLVRPWGLAEAWWIGGGVALLLVLRLVPLRLAGHAVVEGSDVYLFLTGMMLLAALAQEHGVFKWIAAWAVHGAGGSRKRLFTLVYGIGTMVTIFMSNDATAVVLTPAILAAVRQGEVEPLPYLFACAMTANAASFVLPISNPANLVVFHGGLPPLGRWMAAFAAPSVLSIAATFLVLRWCFRRSLGESPSGPVRSTGPAQKLGAEGRMVMAGLAATAGVLLTASALKSDLGWPACAAAGVLAAAVSLKTRRSPLPLLKEVSWATLALVAGLFIMVNGVESIGALRLTQAWLAGVARAGPAAGSFIAGFVVGVLNNLVNNLPLGLIAGATLQAARYASAMTGAKALITHAVMIGVDLGPNLSVTGSLATILWLLALRKEKIEVGFWQFLRIGAVAMPTALAAALGGLVLVEWVGRH
jgi:arsenical pump membrane protein